MQKFILDKLVLDASFSVEDMPSLGEKIRFQISSSAKSFIVYASTIDEKFAWLADIMTALADVQSKITSKTEANAKVLFF